MDAWIDFYDSDHAIYVSPRHRAAHFRAIADDIIGYVTGPEAVVLDYSCGEALDAGRIATACGRLILAEPAPGVRSRLEARFADHPSIAVRSLDDVATLPPASVDLIVMNSVAQYITAADLAATLTRLRPLLKPNGRFVLGDVLRPDTGLLPDVLALLRFAAKEGFLIAAVIGLARLGGSGYRQLRGSLGLTRHAEADVIATMLKAGYDASRAPRNIGYNPARMTFVGTPA
jgi:SAM-dependent methyltransferase